MSEMLTPNQIDLAHAPAFRLGPVSVEPALRQVTTTHSETLEPRVMQVLVVLAMANGRIVSRDDLVRACWEGRIVGDDSISRVIARLRKFAKEHGEDVLRIETITKVGYRLIGPVVYASASQNAPLPSATPAVAATPHIATPSPAAAISIVGPLLPAKPSIAILPLRNINVDPTRDYFADSLTEDLVTELSRWRWFFVISPYSSLRYRNTVNDLVQIGSELGVRYLLDGSVGVTGDQLRIRVRLVDTVDQTTLWAEKYDRNIGEILALQDEITQQIAASIAPAMLDSVRGRAARGAQAFA
jgi:TolB-like protein